MADTLSCWWMRESTARAVLQLSKRTGFQKTVIFFRVKSSSHRGAYNIARPKSIKGVESRKEIGNEWLWAADEMSGPTKWASYRFSGVDSNPGMVGHSIVVAATRTLFAASSRTIELCLDCQYVPGVVLLLLNLPSDNVQGLMRSETKKLAQFVE